KDGADEAVRERGRLVVRDDRRERGEVRHGYEMSEQALDGVRRRLHVVVDAQEDVAARPVEGDVAGGGRAVDRTIPDVIQRGTAGSRCRLEHTTNRDAAIVGVALIDDDELIDRGGLG